MKTKIAGVALAAVVGAFALGGGAQAAQITIAETGTNPNGFIESFKLIFDTDTRLGDLFTSITNVANGQTGTFNGSVSVGQTNYPAENLIVITGTPIGNSPYLNASIYDYPSMPRAGYAEFNGAGFSGASLTITGLLPLPLPSSAPLFGAALLAMGGATYARRRAKAA